MMSRQILDTAGRFFRGWGEAFYSVPLHWKKLRVSTRSHVVLWRSFSNTPFTVPKTQQKRAPMKRGYSDGRVATFHFTFHVIGKNVQKMLRIRTNQGEFSVLVQQRVLPHNLGRNHPPSWKIGLWELSSTVLCMRTHSKHFDQPLDSFGWRGGRKAHRWGCDKRW